MRLGMWNLKSLHMSYLLTGLKPTTLLAMGGWDAQPPFDQYWREAMMVAVPEGLQQLLMPWFAEFKAAVEAADVAGKAVPTCARSLVELLPYLSYVVVQDALELCSTGRPEKYKENPVHQLLLSSQEFRCERELIVPTKLEEMHNQQQQAATLLDGNTHLVGHADQSLCVWYLLCKCHAFVAVDSLTQGYHLRCHNSVASRLHRC